MGLFCAKNKVMNTRLTTTARGFEIGEGSSNFSFDANLEDAYKTKEENNNIRIMVFPSSKIPPKTVWG